MLTLLANESRVLGVLIEKALTVPASYPLTLNALVSGCNQKNNRDPLTNYDEEDVLDALDGLRRKGLAVEVFLSGSRVAKYRHVAREKLAVANEELVLLVELLLRGPQSPGELRSRASRMAPLDSLEKTIELLESLAKREPPMVRELPPSARARRFGQLLCPDLHPLDHGRDSEPADAPTPPDASHPAPPELAARVAALEQQVAAMRAALSTLARTLGEPDPFPSGG